MVFYTMSFEVVIESIINPCKETIYDNNASLCITKPCVLSTVQLVID